MKDFVIAPRLPAKLKHTAARHGIRPSRFILSVSVARQQMSLFERAGNGSSDARFPEYAFRRRYVVSTSRHGIGQVMHSHRTPLGLHRVAKKVGGGHPVGTVFTNRRAAICPREGRPDAGIVHRIFWLEGLEPGFNRGGKVDTFRRFIYIHGFGDETSLGRPQSSGCVHMAAADLMPLYEQVPEGTLVWIGER